MRFANSPLLWLLSVVALIAAAYALRAWLGYREVRADARREYDYRQLQSMRGAELGFERFERAYMRANAPRAARFTAIALAAIVLLTAPALRLADLVMTGLWRLSGNSRVFEPPFLVYQFGIFFMMIGMWALIGYAAARTYHKDSAVSFDEELRRERGEL